MAEVNEEQIEKYGDLKLAMESEGDGYFFWGYGLPSRYKADADLKIRFDKAASAIDDFKTYIEKKITDNGGNPEDWEY